MRKVIELLIRQVDARAAHKVAFQRARETDHITNGSFCVFSENNPHTAEVDNTAIALQKAIAAVEAERERLGVNAFNQQVIAGMQEYRDSLK